jgi:HEAT repeat protein
MKKIAFFLAVLIFCAPFRTWAGEEVDSLLYRLRDESPFTRFKIIEEIGDLGTPDALDALISLFSDEELRWMAVRQIAMFKTVAVPPLIEALSSEDADVIRFAIYTLGEVRAEAAIKPIIAFLGHPDPEVRQNAVFALGMLKATEATDQLIEALEDDDPVVRGYAATALGEIGDPKAKEALVAALKKEDASVVNMATSLHDLGSDLVVQILIEKLRDPDPNKRLYAIYALGRISDPKEIQPLIDVLYSDEIGWLAAQALVNIGEPAVPTLLEALFSENRNTRLYTTYALGEIGDVRAGRGLLKMFKDEDSLVRDTAAEALITLNDERLVPPLSRELSSPDPRVRQKAIDVLGQIGDASLVETIASYLNDPDLNVVKSAVLSMGNLGSEKASRHLVVLLGSSRPDIQDTVRTAFISIGDPAIPDLIEVLQEKGTIAEATAITILGKLKASEAVSALFPYLRHPEPSFRRLATVALTEIGDPSAEEYFVSLLNDPDPSLRIYASIGLMNIGGRIAIKLLLASLGNPDTQWLAVRILDRIAKRDVDALIEALKEEQTRWYARKALVELDGAILPRLEEGLRSEDPVTRESIAMVLGEVKDRRAVKPLLEALLDEDRFVASSAASLIKIGDPGSVEPLIEMLSNSQEHIRLYAAYALGGLNDTRAVRPLIEMLADPSSNLRGVTAHSLGQIGSREATDAILALLDDTSENVRLTAVLALGKLQDRKAIIPLEDILFEDSSGKVRKAARQVLDEFELRAGP